MIKRALLLSIALLFSIITPSVFANETTDPSLTPKPTSYQQIQKYRAAEVRTNVMERKETLEASREARMVKRDAMKDELKERIENARSEWAEKKEAMKENLEKIKDERKAKIVENIHERLANRNEHWVEHWRNVLERHSELLDKIESRAAEAQTNGRDVSAVTAAVAKARAAIVTAEASVDTQSTKTYTISVTTEEALGAAVSAAIAQMQADVKVVVATIEVVRKATQDAITSLKPVASPKVTPVP